MLSAGGERGVVAYTRRLPDDGVLLQHAEDGLTNKEIGEKYGVTAEAARRQLARAGFQRPPRPHHGDYIPWRVRADHVGHLLARRLRAYSKAQQGFPLTDSEERLLTEWQAWMDGDNKWGLPMAVHYDRNDDDGFWVEPAKPGDDHYIHRP